MDLSVIRSQWASAGLADVEITPHGAVVGIAESVISKQAHNILVGLDYVAYQVRYTYRSRRGARGALRRWREAGFEGEPKGYIRKARHWGLCTEV